ncbi:C40 family peptidase [Candidatus Pacearchaeota archaeon]|nr:C40 family peptidase [Candidatus Pacearchaeota archaeon]
MRDINEYVGIPWVKGGDSIRDGADCWGLVLLVLNDIFAIQLSSYRGSKAAGDELAYIINREAGSQEWPLNTSPKAADVVVMQSHGSAIPDHVGVYLGVGKGVIHSPGSESIGSSSRISSLRAVRKQYRYVDFYTYAGS